MPGMNGFELARRLRAAGSTARLVFLTVHEEEELILAAKNAGGLGYVVKTRLASDLETGGAGSARRTSVPVTVAVLIPPSDLRSG